VAQAASAAAIGMTATAVQAMGAPALAAASSSRKHAKPIGAVCDEMRVTIAAFRNLLIAGRTIRQEAEHAADGYAEQSLIPKTPA
jgi:hypothetical protein